MYHSQVGQDRYLEEHIFQGKRNGVFVEIGAYDGETLSNTLFFESERDWTGICVEPLPDAFEKLAQRRATAKNVCCAVADVEGEADFLDVDVVRDQKMLSGLVSQYDPRHVQRINSVKVSETVRRVKVRTLACILDEFDVRHVDYLSIDTEGSEMAILRSIDFERYEIDVITVENNYHDPAVMELLNARGFVRVHTFDGYEELYRRRATLEPKTTVICAVWSKDPKRRELLLGHRACLDRQTVPVASVYVFDDGDEPSTPPPPRLSGAPRAPWPLPLERQGILSLVLSPKPLTIYEAWSMALAEVKTPYVLNLNLDDRLCPDAIAMMEEVMAAGADLVGGDWRICYSQAATDKVPPTSWHMEGLNPVPTWPPTGEGHRLGSGEYGTYGPACMWRHDLHKTMPFPTHFPDGRLVRVIGDAMWWRLLASAGKKFARLPLIVGNYHSHPSEQAEFRGGGAAEEEAIYRLFLGQTPLPESEERE